MIREKKRSGLKSEETGVQNEGKWWSELSILSWKKSKKGILDVPECHFRMKNVVGWRSKCGMLEYKVPRLACETKDFVLQDESFQVLRRVVLHCKVSRFRFQSMSFCKTGSKKRSAAAADPTVYALNSTLKNFAFGSARRRIFEFWRQLISRQNYKNCKSGLENT